MTRAVSELSFHLNNASRALRAFQDSTMPTYDGRIAQGKPTANRHQSESSRIPAEYLRTTSGRVSDVRYVEMRTGEKVTPFLTEPLLSMREAPRLRNNLVDHLLMTHFSKARLIWNQAATTGS
jgi:hypothetical protein